MENEELIGTLIESTERIVAALDTYDQLVAAGKQADVEATESIATKLAAATLTREDSSDSEETYSPSPKHQPRNIHPDLEDLEFGALGSSSNRLPPPLQPTTRKHLVDDDDDNGNNDRRGSLSDYSDYESSDEETHKAKAGPSTTRKAYVTVSDDEDDVVTRFSPPGKSRPKAEENPFADPFADDLAAR